MPTCYQTAAAATAMIKMGNAPQLLCSNTESHSDISIPSRSQLEQLTEMSKSSSVSSNIRTLMVTWRPGGMAGGLCPGSNVLMPRVSGAPRRCPAPKAIGSGSGSAMMHCNAHCPACKAAKRAKSRGRMHLCVIYCSRKKMSRLFWQAINQISHFLSRLVKHL